MRVADYVAAFLRDRGIRRVFLLSGTGSVYLDDAFARHPEIRHTCARHEAAAAVMAAGHARLSGTLGVAVVTTGPGGINAIGGVAEAWVDGIPILVVSGQVERRFVRSSKRAFGVQGFDIMGCVGGMTRYAALVDDPESIRHHLEAAVFHATTGRAGPAWLDIPLDVQRAEIDVNRLAPFPRPDPVPPPVDLDAQVARVHSALAEAKRPVIVLGQGVRMAGALAPFRTLSRQLDAPIVATRLALDLLPLDHPDHMGLGGIRGRRHTGAVLRGADLVLALGSSLAPAFVGDDFEAFSADARVLMVDNDPDEQRRGRARVDIGVPCDLAVFLPALSERLRALPFAPRPEWRDACRALAAAHPTVGPDLPLDPVNSYRFVAQLEAASGAEHVFVSDAGSAYYVTGQTLTFRRGQRELTSGTYATMGVALPLAVGAATCSPSPRVLVVTGDGSIELNIQELRTIAQYDLDVKIFVINNGGYASIRDSQDVLCGGRYTDATETLDFSRVAAAFGLPFHLLDCHAAIVERLPAILAPRGPALVEVVCDQHQEIFRPLRSLP